MAVNHKMEIIVIHTDHLDTLYPKKHVIVTKYNVHMPHATLEAIGCGTLYPCTNFS